MRWFVDISAIGSGGKASRFCVEAGEWQRALQSVRGLRGDTSPFSNFSIELLDDGYRAIDPLTRTRFVVQKAPEGAELTTRPIEVDTGASLPPPPLSKPAETKSRVTDRQRRARGAADNAVKPNEAVKANEAPKANGVPKAAAHAEAAPPAPPVPPRPAVPEVAPAAPAPAPRVPSKPPPAPAAAPTALLPRFKVISERSQEPTQASPITYREIAIALPEGASDTEAEAVARAQFETMRSALRSAPSGQFINLAVFDHEFTGKPQRPPVAVLAFKDWQKTNGRDAEPILRFPLRGGPVSAAPSGPGPVSAPGLGLPPPPALPSEPTTPGREIPLPADSITSVGPPPGTEDNPEEIDVEPDPTETPAIAVGTPHTPIAAGTPHTPIAAGTPHTPDTLHTETPTVPLQTQAAAAPAPALAPVDRSLGARGVHPVIDVAGLTEPVASAMKPTSEPAPAPQPPPPAPRPPVVEEVAPPVEQAAPVVREAPPPVVRESAPPAVRESAPPVSAAPKVVSAPPPSAPAISSIPRPSAPSLTPQRRSSGENLIIELFEAVSDLAMLHDPLEGADFVLKVALENMPSAAAMVSFFSLNSREFVAVRAAGEKVGQAEAQAILLKSVSERAAIPSRAMRSQQTVVLDEAQATEALAEDPRWVATGVVPVHYMCAPVALGGRYLGLLEIANPSDGVAFSAEDGYALTYIGQQLGEFLSQRDIVLDPERITAPRLNARIRRG